MGLFYVSLYMNFIFLSPHFPPNYYPFCIHLRSMGVNVLGIADEAYDSLHPELRAYLNEYYWVEDLHNYDALLRACGYFTHKYGKIDRLDSHNEYWLETEAKLRTDFNITGLKVEDMPQIKRKSLMKETYKQAGVRVARGGVANTLIEAKQLIKDIGFPIVAKPDIGVGAAATYKIHNPSELEDFYLTKPPIEYILEEFVQGTILTFDGLTDQDGRLVFYTAHQYSQGVMETVNSDGLVYYYSLRDIPDDLEDTGRKVLNAFDVRERFFHFEFFRDSRDKKITALEVNMRPPGGLTTDMFNYANDIDIYKEWAHVIVNNQFTADYHRPKHCCYAGRKHNRNYKFSHEEILEIVGSNMAHHEPISGVFSAALGDYGYLFLSTDLDEIHATANLIQQLDD
jgi:hypothetical protein